MFKTFFLITWQKNNLHLDLTGLTSATIQQLTLEWMLHDKEGNITRVDRLGLISIDVMGIS